MSTINIDGIDFPVTDAWYAQNILNYPQFAAMNYDQLDRDRLSLLDKNSDTTKIMPIGQKAVAWTPGDADMLQVVTRVLNAHRATRWLQGRPLSDFGFTGVDQVHGNAAHVLCGCKLQYCFDHHLAQANENFEQFPHHPIAVCSYHLPLFKDIASYPALHARVFSDCQKVQTAINTALDPGSTPNPDILLVALGDLPVGQLDLNKVLGPLT